MRRWAPRPVAGEPDGLILFDGVCVFCSRWVRFVIRHDRDRRFRFVAIQSETGRRLAARYGINPDNPETNAVILDGRIFFKSDAAIQVLSRLPVSRLLSGLDLVPAVVRDFAYDRIARNRYRIFGRTQTCMVPTMDDRGRFLT